MSSRYKRNKKTKYVTSSTPFRYIKLDKLIHNQMNTFSNFFSLKQAKTLPIFYIKTYRSELPQRQTNWCTFFFVHTSPPPYVYNLSLIVCDCADDWQSDILEKLLKIDVYNDWNNKRLYRNTSVIKWNKESLHLYLITKNWLQINKEWKKKKIKISYESILQLISTVKKKKIIKIVDIITRTTPLTPNSADTN